MIIHSKSIRSIWDLPMGRVLCIRNGYVRVYRSLRTLDGVGGALRLCPLAVHLHYQIRFYVLAGFKLTLNSMRAGNVRPAVGAELCDIMPVTYANYIPLHCDILFSYYSGIQTFSSIYLSHSHHHIHLLFNDAYISKWFAPARADFLALSFCVCVSCCFSFFSVRSDNDMYIRMNLWIFSSPTTSNTFFYFYQLVYSSYIHISRWIQDECVEYKDDTVTSSSRPS